MNKLQNRYLRQTFGKLTQEQAVHGFEQKLLELSPNLSVIEDLGNLLLGALAVLMQNLHDLEGVKKTAQIFISRYNLRTEDLQNIQRAFCWTLEDYLQIKLSAQVKDAWWTFFDLLLAEIPKYRD